LETNKTTAKQVSMKLIATLAPAQAEIEAGLWLRLTNAKIIIQPPFIFT
jgi:adenosylmethionine-8-amino-7-oxononanoate aminotransferase